MSLGHHWERGSENKKRKVKKKKMSDNKKSG